MDAPQYRSVNALVEMAKYKKEWKQMCDRIRPRKHKKAQDKTRSIRTVNYERERGVGILIAGRTNR